MNDLLYGHNGVPATLGPATLIHDFLPADRNRHIHQITLVEYGRRTGWLNDYISDQVAHDLSRKIHYDLSSHAGVSHTVGHWPGR